MSLTVRLPMTEQAHYTESQQASLATLLTELQSRYSALVKQAAEASNVPEGVLYAKMLIENAQGNATIVTGAGAVGLMQIKPLAATDYVVLERQARRLTEREKALLRQLLGVVKYDALMKAELGRQIITTADLQKPALNLLIASIHASTLIAEHTQNKTVRFDLVGLRYNQGYYFRRVALQNYTQSTDQLLTTLTGEARSYVLKYVGRNGTLELTT